MVRAEVLVSSVLELTVDLALQCFIVEASLVARE